MKKAVSMWIMWIHRTSMVKPVLGRHNYKKIILHRLCHHRSAALKRWCYGRKLRMPGYVDANYQPLISRTQAALLADAIAERLGIKEKWKVFESLWNRKYMRSDYNLALTRKGSLDFQDELKRLFG